MKKKKKKPPPPPKPVEKIVTCGDSFKTIKDSADLPPGKGSCKGYNGLRYFCKWTTCHWETTKGRKPFQKFPSKSKFFNSLLVKKIDSLKLRLIIFLPPWLSSSANPSVNQEWHYENCVRFPFDGEQLRLAGKDAGKPPKPKFVKQVATGQFWAHNKQKYLVVNGIDDPLDQAEHPYVCAWTDLDDRNNAFRPVCHGCVRNDFIELPEPNIPAPK
ncbi:hypothetical protein PtA15_11A373 [Puccinia triticina]|uniref:Uncharacterized protein n=1 Tax=Puccinia triticina TaxID=208348 RepID=A0ABY7D428_9BASI|nr:uncharacterized protein PtA15_11A373 [Puccinia triticina]WAQ89682.1 hypothetical protein PtA15_11A373 [Puccinia triticina]